MPISNDLLFKALADPTRRALFERLCLGGAQTVGALTNGSGVSQPAVSKHLDVLKEAGLVTDRQDGRRTHYAARRSAVAPLADWMIELSQAWEDRFDNLEDLLRRMDP